MATAGHDKDPGALLTIGELSQQLGVAQHILRYWETKFPQLKPMQRAGNRRYYRPADVQLANRIHSLLTEQGYTVRGVQKLLRSKDAPPPPPVPTLAPDQPDRAASPSGAIPLDRLIALRDRLANAIDA
ncbi:MAG: MerR family transcriptional regulator [Sphingomicrobium sp.]